MNEEIRYAQEAMKTEELQEIAKTLAKYNLGVCIPHMHDAQSGNLVALPSGIVAREQDLKISFVENTALKDKRVEEISWRWNEGKLEVCAACCIGPADGG